MVEFVFQKKLTKSTRPTNKSEHHKPKEKRKETYIFTSWKFHKYGDCRHKNKRRN